MQDIDNLVIVSDLHGGCQFGLCPPKVKLDGGAVIHASPIQRKIYAYWQEFWGQWVPQVTRGEPFALCVNGDALEGNHHGSTTQMSQNLADQAKIVEALLSPIIDNPLCKVYYHIRGTDAHVGPSGEAEEQLAKLLGAKKNKQGNYARFELWVTVGEKLCHILHHIGTTGSQMYESTAVHKELIESLVESSRWGMRHPDYIIRSHRHRLITTEIPADNGSAVSITTPGWQAKTPYVYKIAGGRQTLPQFGGIIIRHGETFTYHQSRCWTIGRDKPE